MHINFVILGIVVAVAVLVIILLKRRQKYQQSLKPDQSGGRGIYGNIEPEPLVDYRSAQAEEFILPRNQPWLDQVRLDEQRRRRQTEEEDESIPGGVDEFGVGPALVDGSGYQPTEEIPFDGIGGGASGGGGASRDFDDTANLDPVQGDDSGNQNTGDGEVDEPIGDDPSGGTDTNDDFNTGDTDTGSSDTGDYSGGDSGGGDS